MVTPVTRSIIACLLVSIVIAGCVPANTGETDIISRTRVDSPAASLSAASCPVTAPVWARPPDDSAVQDPPAFGYYYANLDRTIWASAWWWKSEEFPLRVSEEGTKVGWFRPAGAVLQITGRRLDGQAPSLDAHVPCCYPNRFQASGLYFPTEGCWEVTAQAAGSQLLFIVSVEP